MSNPQYELMSLICIDKNGSHDLTDPNVCYPDGVDSEPCLVGDARQVIQYLLKAELSDYKLVKKMRR